MSDKMRGIPFKTLLENALWEYRKQKSLFHVPVHEASSNCMQLAGRPLSVPIGPAAGPHTQLAQNLLAGFAAGARVFELKTVQIMEGEELGIVKPCIYVDGEAYNTEWSTELTVAEAAEEYIKGYVAIWLLAREFGWDCNFQFHVSVGYDLAGIQSPKIDTFLNTMKDASGSAFWAQCLHEAECALPLFEHVDAAYIRRIDPHISNVVTLSTMHGCPSDEIERIASYLIEEKGFHTYIKCNPTLIGYRSVRSLLDQLGYGYMVFDTTHFEHDMKLEDAVDMIHRLMRLAEKKGLSFGVKLTNTFPVEIRHGELSGDAMYMSGKPLFPLAIHVAKALSEATSGRLPISFSGGIDPHNIASVLACGIAPVTVATLLLKTGGYQNLTRLAALVPDRIPHQVDCEKLRALCDSILSDPYYQKQEKKSRARNQTAPPAACFKCKNCVDVCPNRANFPLPDLKSAIHMDSYCNECGNCACLCPFGYVPYRDKFTYFDTLEDFESSQNDGFFGHEKYRYLGQTGTDVSALPEEVRQVIDVFLNQGGQNV
ncbi:MAG: selenate reductase [Clostridiaceae bacterium]|nr:selenate reductase [Clostridiaceae bacterium]